MAEAVAFDDVEALLVPYLRARLEARDLPTSVSTRIPDQRPDRLVKVTRTGGARRNLVTDAPIVMFECWDVDEPAAADLGRIVRAEVQALDDDVIPGLSFRAEVGGLAAWPDPDTRTPRYVHSQELRVRGHAI